VAWTRKPGAIDSALDQDDKRLTQVNRFLAMFVQHARHASCDESDQSEFSLRKHLPGGLRYGLLTCPVYFL
jgi:hypothetical protein